MNVKKKSSIFKKTQIYLILFCASILILLWLTEIFFFKIYYEKYQIKLVTKIANTILNTDASSDTFEIAVEDYAYDNNVCISIYDSYGEVKAYNSRMIGCALNTKSSSKIIYNFLIGDNKSITYKLRTDKDVKGFLYAIKNDTRDIFVYAPLEDVSTATIIMKEQLIYITIISIIISSGIAIFLSKIITSPIRKITKSAMNIGKENYDFEFESSGILEIDELADTLNTVRIELGKVQTYQKDLLANVSHDLKTPLTMIKAYAEKIGDISYKDKTKLDKDVSVIMDEADRLTLLVNDILDYSKLNESSLKLNLESYDLVDEIKNILKKYEIIKETENYNFITNIPENAFVTADKNKINQVIYNLINNAINYTGEDKKVTIELIPSTKSYEIRIADTGKGIKSEDIKNIWTKYYKNDKNHQRNVISTGLGLSIVKEILEKHNYKYGVNSVINKGSTFYFIIPKSSSRKHINNTKKD